jgi:hypothetical protein
MTKRSIRALLAGLGVLAATLLGACSGGGAGGLTAPVIAVQPADASVPSGQKASFSVVAAATPAPSYQWRRNGSDIPGATSANYVTPALVLADGGAVYSVAVSNSQGAVVSNPARLGVTAVTSAEKRSLLGLMDLAAQLYLAGLAPMKLEQDWVFIEPTDVCMSGVGAATLNGVPAFAGQEMPYTASVSATFNACAMLDGTSFNGIAAAAYDFPDPDTWTGTASFTMTEMRLTSRSGGVVDMDYTVNGTGLLAVTDSTLPTEHTFRFLATPAAGATLRNELDGLTATFATGALDITVGMDSNGRLRLNYTWNNLNTNISGVAYVANGFYELIYDAQGALASAAGEVNFTADGASIGRIYATPTGLAVEVDGVAAPMKAPSGALRR